MADDKKADQTTTDDHSTTETPKEITTVKAAEKLTPAERAAQMAAENASTVPMLDKRDRTDRQKRAAQMAGENAKSAESIDSDERQQRKERAAQMAAENAASR